MSIMTNDYFYSKPLKQDIPAWYRHERYEYCERFDENTVSAKRGIFSRRFGKKVNK